MDICNAWKNTVPNSQSKTMKVAYYYYYYYYTGKSRLIGLKLYMISI